MSFTVIFSQTLHFELQPLFLFIGRDHDVYVNAEHPDKTAEVVFIVFAFVMVSQGYSKRD